jgi:hypothetical protein
MARAGFAARNTNPYSVHPGIVMVQNWVASLKEKTGRSLDEWLQLIKKAGPAGEKERRDWLKSEHRLGTNSAWWLAERAEGKGTEDEDPEKYLQAAVGWVEAMFAGPKQGLRPLYDQLLQIGLKLGKDVRVCPCKTIVPFYRHHVFAQIKPSTRTRLDLGFSLGATKPTERLIDTCGLAKKDRITHRIPISTSADIDAEVIRWLKAAYELDA